MSDINELYQSIILDHSKRPRGYGVLDGATHQADGYNALCGDKINVYLMLHENRIEEIAFESASCAICKASASMMMEELAGTSIDEVGEVLERVRALLEEDVQDDSQGDLSALQGVRKFPSRIKCATLPWETLRDAIES